MNKLCHALLDRVRHDKGAGSLVECVLNRCMQATNVDGNADISIFDLSKIVIDCGGTEYQSVMEYLIHPLRLFDLCFKLYLTDDEVIELSEEEIQHYLKEKSLQIGGGSYSAGYIGSHTVVFLRPRARFRRILES